MKSFHRKLGVIAVLCALLAWAVGSGFSVSSAFAGPTHVSVVGGTARNDHGYDVTVDSADNVYIVGFFMGTVDFDPGTGTYNHTSTGDRDIYLSKFDAAGDYQWTLALGSSEEDWGFSIAVDENDDVYITGFFSGTVDFDPGPGTANHTSVGNYDVFLAKYDGSGSYLWSKAFGGADYDYGRGVIADKAGSIYLTGWFRNTVDFDPSAGTDNHTAVGQCDVFLSKYGTDGSYQWCRTFGGIGNDGIGDRGYDVDVDHAGGVYVAGSFETTVDFDPGAGTDEHTSTGDRDIFLSKFDTTGNQLWTQVAGTANIDAAYSVAADASGVYLTGRNNGAAISMGSDTTGDIFLSRYDTDGTIKWTKVIGGGGCNEGLSVAIDGSGNAYLAGFFEGTLDFDPGADVNNHTSSGQRDIFLSNFDTSGTHQSTETFGSTSRDYGEGITVSNAGNVYITGKDWSNVELAGYSVGQFDFLGQCYINSAYGNDWGITRIGAVVSQSLGDVSLLTNHPFPEDTVQELHGEEFTYIRGVDLKFDELLAGTVTTTTGQWAFSLNSNYLTPSGTAGGGSGSGMRDMIQVENLDQVKMFRHIFREFDIGGPPLYMVRDPLLLEIWGDGTPPIATISGTPTSPTNSTDAVLTVGGMDVVSYKHKLDSGSYSSETSVATQISLSGLGEGTHTVSGIGKDAAGNWQLEADTTTTTWTVDLTAPSGSIAINNGEAYCASRNVSLTLNSSDATSMCFSNGGSTFSGWEAYSTSKSWTLADGDGTKTVYVKFKDSAGNISTAVSDSIILDTTAPSGSIAINNGATYCTNRNVSLALNASDAAYMCFSNDGSTFSGWEAYSTSKSWTLADGDGTKTVYVKYKDEAGNISTAVSDSIILDTTPPSGSIAINGDATYSNSRNVSLTLNSSDAAYMCFSNDGSTFSGWEAYSTSKSWTLADGDGTKTVYVKFKDSAGNISTAVSDSIILDSVPAPETDEEFHDGEDITEDSTIPEGLHLSNVTVETGVTLINNGTLTDVTNYGTIDGGRLDGDITNNGTIIGNVTLTSGTCVDGGVVSGELTGEGDGAVITNALVDVTSISNVTIGLGCMVTENTINDNPGLDLTGAITDEGGVIRSDVGLFVDASGEEQTVNDLLADAINDMLADDTTFTQSFDDGTVIVSSDKLKGMLVPAKVQSVVTTEEDDAIQITQSGELVIIKNGIAMTLAPACVNMPSFESALYNNGINGNVKKDGVVIVHLPGPGGGFRLSLRFCNVAEKTASTKKSASESASFSVVGGPSDLKDFFVLVTYPDGTKQKMPPFVHDLGQFKESMGAVNYRIDPSTGVIELLDSDGESIWKGIPDYFLLDSPDDTTGISFETAGDVNGDGLIDFYMITETGKQIIYALP